MTTEEQERPNTRNPHMSKPAILFSAMVFSLSAFSCARSAGPAAHNSPAAQKPEDLLAHMRTAYKSVQSATYGTDVDITTQAGQQKFTVDWAYKAPNMIRAIIKFVNGQTAGIAVTKVTDGKKITISASNGNSGPGQDFTVDNFENQLPGDLESLCFFDWERQLSTTPGKNMANSTFKVVPNEEWNGKHWTVLEETAKKDNAFVRYFIDPKTYFIWRTIHSNLDDKKPILDSKLTRMDPHARVDDSIFTGS